MLVMNVINKIEEWIYALYTKNIILAIVLSSTALYAEPLFYGLGSDYDSNEVQENAPIERSLDDLYQKVQDQEERIDGLRTLVEGLSLSIKELKNPKENINSLTQMAKILDEINQNYVSKEELEALLGKKISSSKIRKTENKTLDEEAKHLSKEEHYKTAVKLFIKKRYAKAKIHFLYTVKKDYKLAGSNYYLGEIAYFSHKYKDAIDYFKKSVSLYDQAPYLDTLLLHTAISFEKISELDQARAFYENIIETYPQKQTAKIAKKRLEKL